MTDINEITQPFRSMDGWEVNSTLLLTPSAVAGTPTSAALIFANDTEPGANSSAGRPMGEFTVDVVNGCSCNITVCFGHNSAAALTPFASPASYFMLVNDHRSFLVPPNTNYISINPALSSATGGVAATTGHGRA